MKAATAAEKRHMDAVAALGCIVRDVHCRGRVCIHHVRHGTSKRNHMVVLPLCENHHQQGGIGVAFHAGKKSWAANYGTQEGLLVLVASLLG